jgi:SAM-dependent methyltransferase
MDAMAETEWLGSQEAAFLEGEADAWFRRNQGSNAAVSADDPILDALRVIQLPERGTLCDIGGSSGRFAAGFLRDYPRWTARVVEPSLEAIHAGRESFPSIEFLQGSISNPIPDFHGTAYDLVLVSGVLCWVDRSLISRAIANTDAAVADGGVLVISDFDPPFPRANPYSHLEGLFTYKQDYVACFLALGIYQLELRRTIARGSAANQSDPYDRHWVTAVLRKTLRGRYAGT